MHQERRRTAAFVGGLLLGLFGEVAFAAAPDVTLLTPAAPGFALANLSADGRWLGFETGPFNGNQAYVVDTGTGAVTLLSHVAGSPATPCPGDSETLAVSRDGNELLFDSSCTDLVPGQSNPVFPGNLFLYDRRKGTNVLVSHRAGAPATSANDYLIRAVLSADGRFVASQSGATDLVAGVTDGNGTYDVFLYDRTTGAHTLVSHQAGAPAIAAGGNSGLPAISADGRFVVYESNAVDLVAGISGLGVTDNVYLYDRTTGANTLVSHVAGDPSTWSAGVFPVLSADGRFIAFDGGRSDLVAGETRGTGSGGPMNAYLWDRTTDTTVLLSHRFDSPTRDGNDDSSVVGLSADGRFVLWSSQATDLLAGQTSDGGPDLFLYDRLAGTSVLVSHVDGSATAGGGVWQGQLSADGAFVVFSSYAAQLAPGQQPSPTAFPLNVYLYDRVAGTTSLLSHPPGSPLMGGNLSAGLGPPMISADGARIVFTSSATDLVASDTDGQDDIFLSVHPLPGRSFFTLPPCRLLDTRSGGSGTPLASGVAVTSPTRGACGIPDGARAIAANVTVVAATGQGHLTLYPGDAAAPETTAISFAAGQTRTNNAILQLSLDGLGFYSLAPVVTGAGGTVHVTVDVSGYFE